MSEMLIVDDEPFAIEGIRLCRDWSAMGIAEVHTANHADQAKAIMTERRIDILICDIEMPDEDGLSLVRWKNIHSPWTETLFLTCHSDFHYAKQAIHLGSFDYLLKPVDGEELSRAVSKMLDAVREKEETARYNRMYLKYRDLWQKQQPVLAEKFWQDLLSRRILTFGDFLKRALEDAQMGLAPDSPVMPVLVSIEEWLKPMDVRDQEIMEYAVRKAAAELFFADGQGDVVQDKSGVLFVLIYDPEKTGEIGMHGQDKWREISSGFLAACRGMFFCQVTCYLGRLTPLQELPTFCEHLKAMERSNVTRVNSVLEYVPSRAWAQADMASEAIPVSEWTACMLNGDRERLLALIGQRARGLEKGQPLNQRQLEVVYHDTLQIVYGFLQAKGISSAQIPHFAMWATAQIRSLAQYRQWAENLVSNVLDAGYSAKEAESVIQKSIQFIKEKVEEDISRDHIAEYVGMNPAYLSRLFRKETGQSLIDCLIETKMNRAKSLMDATGMTISAIAQQVGYSNFSHFAKMFKKQFGVNPQEYRKSQND